MFCTNCGSQLVDGHCTTCATPAAATPAGETPATETPAALGAPTAIVQAAPTYGGGAGGAGQGYGTPPPGYGTPPPGYGTPPGYGAGGVPLATASGEPYPEWLLAKFNWGALAFGWWWALWNTDVKRKWIGVGCFLFGFFSGGLSQLGFAIYVGISGNRLAATYRRFETVEQFRATQRAWALWGLIVVGITVVLGVLALVLGILGAIYAAATGHATT